MKQKRPAKKSDGMEGLSGLSLVILFPQYCYIFDIIADS